MASLCFWLLAPVDVRHLGVPLVAGELVKRFRPRAQFPRRVAVAGKFLPLLFAREARRAPGLSGFVLRQSDMSRSQHGKNLAHSGGQGESEHGEPPGQFGGRPVEINILFEQFRNEDGTEDAQLKSTHCLSQFWVTFIAAKVLIKVP